MIAALAYAAALQTAAAPAADPLAALGLHTVQPMSAEDTAAMRTRVDATLARDHAQSAFDNVTDPNGGAVRARVSGLRCALGKPGQSVTAGSDGEAACRGGEEGRSYVTRVTRAAPGETLDVAYAAALATARQEAGFTAYRGVVMDGHPKPGSGRPDHRNLRYLSNVDGAQRFTKVQVGIVDGWVLTERATGPLPVAGAQPDMGEIMSEATFGTQLRPPG